MKRLLAVCLLLAFGLTQAVNAQTATKTTAITITPFFQDIVIGGRQPEFTVAVNNNTSSLYSFKARAVDFGSLNDTGGILFAGGQSQELSKKYGLTKWLKVDNPNQTLAAGQSVKIRFRVDNRPDLTPGGHYAAIVLNDVSKGKSKLSASVGFQNNLSSLIFAKKLEGANFSHQAKSLYDNHNLLTTASRAELAIQNTGNVHIVPRGEVKIIGPFNRQIARGAINEESSIILPGTTRTVSGLLNPISSAVLPGYYRTLADYRYEGGDKLKHVEIKYFYLGWPLTLIASILLVWLGRRAYRAL
jgi:hypothetical protein